MNMKKQNTILTTAAIVALLLALCFVGCTPTGKCLANDKSWFYKQQGVRHFKAINQLALFGRRQQP